MAKVKSPLMSLTASGSLGGAMTFMVLGKNQVVRKLTKPKNPMTLAQAEIRNKFRVCGAAQRFANRCSLKSDGSSYSDKQLMMLKAWESFRRKNSWVGNLADIMIGKNCLYYSEASSNWDGLSDTNKASWNTAAAALTPKINGVAQKVANNAPGPTFPAGKVFYLYRYALYRMGLKPAPVATTPPTYI
jgi:hypothetical protein